MNQHCGLFDNGYRRPIKLGRERLATIMTILHFLGHDPTPDEVEDWFNRSSAKVELWRRKGSPGCCGGMK